MEMRAELRIDARPGAAWAVIGEQFGQVGDWACPITDSSIDGPPGAGVVRTCHIAGFGPVGPGVITERLTLFDPAGRSLEYEAAEGMPSFIVRAVNRWSVHAGPGGTCVVRVHATLTLRPWARALGPLLRWRMRAASRQVLDDLRHRVETGLPHPRKAAALAGCGPQP